MYAENVAEHIAARRLEEQKDHRENAPFDVERNAAANWHAERSRELLDTVFVTIMKEAERPNKQQKSFLEHFVRRLHVEILQARQQTQNTCKQEPLLDLVHGFPGTGKSRVIGWMRRLMEDGLGWEHGVQFVCLAFQNAMAAQINGSTLHHVASA